MKIEHVTPHPAVAPERRPKQQPTARLPDPQNEEAYSVSLSSLPKHGIPESDEEEIRRAKVAAIRDQLASGTYNISGKDVANKILGALKS